MMLFSVTKEPNMPLVHYVNPVSICLYA